MNDINESRLKYEWVMVHIWMSHVTHMHESNKRNESYTLHMHESRTLIAFTNSTHAQVVVELFLSRILREMTHTLYIWKSHELHTYEWVTNQIFERVTNSTYEQMVEVPVENIAEKLVIRSRTSSWLQQGGLWSSLLMHEISHTPFSRAVHELCRAYD